MNVVDHTDACATLSVTAPCHIHEGSITDTVMIGSLVKLAVKADRPALSQELSDSYDSTCV